MDYLLMRVCAMRLDPSVKSQDFVNAVQDIERETRRNIYFRLAKYGDRAGAEKLRELVIATAEGRLIFEPENESV